MKRLVFYTMVQIGLFAALVIGVFAQAPGLMLAWFCLSVPVGVLMGRASVRAFTGRRAVFVNDVELQAIQKYRRTMP